MGRVSFGIAAILLGLFVYAADITKTGGQRTMSLALVEMSIGLGQCCLNVVAGLFIEEMGKINMKSDTDMIRL